MTKMATMNYDQFVNKYDLRINFTEYYEVRAAVNTYIRNKDIQFHSESGSNCYIPFSVKEILKKKKKKKTGVQKYVFIIKQKK